MRHSMNLQIRILGAPHGSLTVSDARSVATRGRGTRFWKYINPRNNPLAGPSAQSERDASHTCRLSSNQALLFPRFHKRWIADPA